MKKLHRFLLTLFLLISLHNSRGATYLVTTVNDGGTGSLRQALISANTNIGMDTINFMIGGVTWNITLASHLPSIDDSLFINGSSQPGSVFNGNMVTLTTNTNLVKYGLLPHCHNITISGLNFTNFSNGAGIETDYLSLYTTYKNIRISNNCFRISKYGIDLAHFGFQNLNINNNVFRKCSASSINLNPASASDHISILNNDILGDTLAMFNTGISLGVSPCLAFRIYNLDIGFNLIGECKVGFQASDFGKLDSIFIHHNNFHHFKSTAPNTFFGEGSSSLLNDSCKNVYIENNYFQSGSGIYFSASSILNSVCYKNVTISKNSLQGGILLEVNGTGTFVGEIEGVKIDSNFCNYGIECNLDGTGNVTGYIKNLTITNNYLQQRLAFNFIGTGYFTGTMKNIRVENNQCYKGIEVAQSFTGSFIGQIDTFAIKNNTIRNSSGNGIKFYIDGISSTRGYISNVDITKNNIDSCFKNGIMIETHNSGLGRSYIYNLNIDSNNIQYNSNNGILINSGSIAGTGRYIYNIWIKHNIISDNLLNGISLQTISTNPFSNIEISKNSIFNNSTGGIFETSTTVYANPKLPEPVLTCADVATSVIWGYLQSKPGTVYDIEFFSNLTPGFNGKGEGERYFLTHQVTTDTSGYAWFQVNIPSGISGPYFSCTATDTLYKSTSEFSNAINTCRPLSISGVNETDYALFPNPANDVVHLISNASGVWNSISITDLSGRTITSIHSDSKSNSTDLDVSSLPNGYYLVNILNESGSSSKKLVIQH